MFCEFMPDSPDNAIQIINYANSIGTLGFDYGICAYRFQVVVRSESFEESDDVSYRLYTLFNSGITESERLISLTDMRKVIIRPLQRPFFLKRDEKERILYTFNMIVHTDGR